MGTGVIRPGMTPHYAVHVHDVDVEPDALDGLRTNQTDKQPRRYAGPAPADLALFLAGRERHPRTDVAS